MAVLLEDRGYSIVGVHLSERITETIRRDGPIAFAAFMDAALYDDEEGFYARPPVGRERAYVTSPHISSLFGRLMARQVVDSWDACGSPDTFAVVELGAGDGTLARQILAALPDPLVRCVRPFAVERSAGARRALHDAGIEVVATLGELPAFTDGLVFANELLDNIAFHRLRMRDGELLEVFIDADLDGGFIEVESAPTPEALAALTAPSLVEGEERPVSPGWAEIVADAGKIIERGHLLFVDYGFSRAAGEEPTVVSAYLGQRHDVDVLSIPGSRDITVSIDIDAVCDAARRSELTVWPPVSQKDALRSLGFRKRSEELRIQQAEAQEQGRSRDAVRLFSERGRTSLLVDPSHLGRFRFLCFGRGDVRAPLCSGV